jgi:hypothetical protein
MKEDRAMTRHVSLCFHVSFVQYHRDHASIWHYDCDVAVAQLAACQL